MGSAECGFTSRANSVAGGCSCSLTRIEVSCANWRIVPTLVLPDEVWFVSERSPRGSLWLVPCIGLVREPNTSARPQAPQLS